MCVCLLQEMREKMKTDTSLLVVGGADEQVSEVSLYFSAVIGLIKQSWITAMRDDPNDNYKGDMNLVRFSGRVPSF